MTLQPLLGSLVVEDKLMHVVAEVSEEVFGLSEAGLFKLLVLNSVILSLFVVSENGTAVF